MTMEIGRDCEWANIIGQIFRVLEFDRAGTTVKGDKVKAKSLFKPYGYLLVESPILNEPVRLPIIHRNDFLLAASVFDEPEWLEVIKKQELLVTYVPKKIRSRGLSGSPLHVLHYVITPRETLERYYEVGNDIHMAIPAPEKVFGALVWDGLLRVQVNPKPKI